MASGVLFISEECEHCKELISRQGDFRPDVHLTFVSVDNNDKKTQKLIEAFSVEGVPTLVIDNEKHSDGIDVFTTLLKIKRGRAPPKREQLPHQDDVYDEVVENVDPLGDVDGGALLDFDVPDNTRNAEGNDTQSLESRMKQFEEMRKQADDTAKEMNRTLSDRKMITSRQMDFDD